MRHLFDVVKQQKNMPRTTARIVAVVLISVGMTLHPGKAPPPGVGDASATKPVSVAIASSDTTANKLVRDAFATVATMPLGDAFAIKLARASIAAGSDASATQPVGDAVTTQVGNAVASQPLGNAIATKPASDAIATKPAGGSISTKPGSEVVATKKAAPALRTTLANEWQDWQYCLAPSHAERKIYLSAPIPMTGSLGQADAAFHEMLNKAGIPHDEVQCPKAPNKRTLLFRQRNAIRLNDEIGNATIDLNWEPSVDWAAKSKPVFPTCSGEAPISADPHRPCLSDLNGSPQRS